MASSSRRRPISALAVVSSFLLASVVVVVVVAIVTIAPPTLPSNHHRADRHDEYYDATSPLRFPPLEYYADDNATVIPDDDIHDNDQSSSSSSSWSSSSSDHTPLFPLHATDVFGFLCASLGLIIAAGGGIGGGGMLVPIYMLVLGFGSKHAIPLSNVTVFGGAVANTMHNGRKRHPRADRPLIDWDLILIMEPPTLAGALLGSNLNKVLPDGVILVLLVLLLSVTAYGTLNKARRMHGRETEGMRRSRIGFDDGGDGGAPSSSSEYLLLGDSTPSFVEEGGGEYDDEGCGVAAEEDEEEVELLRGNERGTGRRSTSSRYVAPRHRPPTLPWRDVVDDDSDDERRQQQQQRNYHQQRCGDNVEDDDGSGDEDLPEFSNPIALEIILVEERRPRRRNVLLIVYMFFVVLLINILKGGGGFDSPLGIACGSTLFWMAQCLLLIWIVLVSWVGRGYLLTDARRKADAGYVYLDDDLRWDRKTTLIYPLISALAGIFAGMFGIGGGIIKGPLMLAMGIHPAVASATSACMILFTSFTATTTFCVYGLMVRDYAIAGGILGFVATYVGQSVMSRMMAKSRRNSYIAFSIGFVVLLSAVLMAVESVIRLASSSEDGAGDRSSGGICDSRHLNASNS